MSSVRVAIAGVGSCASSLIMGCAWYAGRVGDGLGMGKDRGLIFDSIGPYGPGSVKVVAAFDVNVRKVGKDLHEAIFVYPNQPVCPDPLLRYFEEPSGVSVYPGPLLDGVGKSYAKLVPDTITATEEDVVRVLQESGADVLVSYMPVGAEHATLAYAETALQAGVAFVNAVPVYVARRPEIAAAFQAEGLPLIGDDVKGQVGATILHRQLVQLFSDRGVWLEETTQENWGGDHSGDFTNMKDEERLGTKRESKTVAVTSVANRGQGIPPERVSIGPSGIIEGLGDDKKARIWMEGTGFMGNHIHVKVDYIGGDSPNSAAVIYDCVRWAKLARDAGIGGMLPEVSGYYMKAPPVPGSDAGYAEQLEYAEARWQERAASRDGGSSMREAAAA